MVRLLGQERTDRLHFLARNATRKRDVSLFVLLISKPAGGFHFAHGFRMVAKFG